ncbi:uncharacterized protein V1510DRAFT_437899 [Dipodascopsis tothii]|uniref:uncharacterized protein n=1 Tax=Dipodascopsis tothii TaxID=44089 RepID=UPI0034CE42F8
MSESVSRDETDAAVPRDGAVDSAGGRTGGAVADAGPSGGSAGRPDRPASPAGAAAERTPPPAEVPTVPADPTDPADPADETNEARRARLRAEGWTAALDSWRASPEFRASAFGPPGQGSTETSASSASRLAAGLAPVSFVRSTQNLRRRDDGDDLSRSGSTPSLRSMAGTSISGSALRNSPSSVLRGLHGAAVTGSSSLTARGTRSHAAEQSLERLDRILRHNSALPPIFYRDVPGSDLTRLQSLRGLADGDEADEADRLLDPFENELESGAARDVASILNAFTPSLLGGLGRRSSLRRRNSVRRWDAQHAENSAKRRKRAEAAANDLKEKPWLLDLQLVYCDGGWTGDDCKPGNMLSVAPSVYQSQRSRCNIVLKHTSGKPFTLHELIIKAPTSGYSWSVQYGLVFVSMTKDNLVPHTRGQMRQMERYAKQYPVTPSATAGSVAASLRSSPECADDADEWSPLAWDVVDLTEDEDAGDGDDADAAFAGPASYSRANLLSRLYNINAGHSRVLRASHLPYTGFRGRTAAARRLGLDNTFGFFGAPDARNVRVINTEDLPQPPEADDDDDNLFLNLDERARPRDDVHPSADEPDAETLAEPVAKFEIPENKSIYKIVFDSPLSATYVYIQIYSSNPRGSVDIQGIYLNGFIGPRFFPKADWR